MDAKISILPGLIVALPFLSAFVILLTRRRGEKISHYLVALTVIVTFGLSLLVARAVATQGNLKFAAPYLLALGLEFRVDPMGLLFALITSFVWMLATIYALTYMSHEEKTNRFYFFLMLTLAANLGVVLAGNLFTLFIFFEGLGFSAYPLIIHSEPNTSLGQSSVDFFFFLGFS